VSFQVCRFPTVNISLFVSVQEQARQLHELAVARIPFIQHFFVCVQEQARRLREQAVLRIPYIQHFFCMRAGAGAAIA
jgi:hypothetical protein